MNDRCSCFLQASFPLWMNGKRVSVSFLCVSTALILFLRACIYVTYFLLSLYIHILYIKIRNIRNKKIQEHWYDWILKCFLKALLVKIKKQKERKRTSNIVVDIVIVELSCYNIFNMWIVIHLKWEWRLWFFKTISNNT